MRGDCARLRVCYFCEGLGRYCRFPVAAFYPSILCRSHSSKLTTKVRRRSSSPRRRAMSFGSASAHQVDKLVLNQSDDALLPLRAYQKQQSPVAGQTWSLQDLERWPTSLWAFTAASVALLTIEGTLAPRQSTRDAFRNTASQQASIALSLAAYPAITAFFARGEDGQSTFAPAVQHALKLFRSLRHWRRIGIAFLLLFGLATSGVFASRHATSALRASFFVSIRLFSFRRFS